MVRSIYQSYYLSYITGSQEGNAIFKKKDDIYVKKMIIATGTHNPDGGYPPDIRDVTDGISKLPK